MNLNDKNVGLAIYSALVALVPVYIWVITSLADAWDRWMARRKSAAGGENRA